MILAAISGPAWPRPSASPTCAAPAWTCIWCEGPIGLGQQLLWVTPESQHERGPVVDVATGLAIVAASRLDNRDVLLQVLALPPALWSTLPDSQVLLYAYRQWDTACVERLLGDFAFVIWDGPRQRLFGASDYMGMRALYYYHDDRRFIFASEIKGLLAHPDIPRRLNEQTLARLAVPASLLLDKSATFFAGIQQFPAAATLTVTATNQHWRPYWEPDRQARLHLPEAEGFEAFQELWGQAVAARVRSPYPMASLLSGGLDSSAVVAVAARELQRQNRRLLLTFALAKETSRWCR
jgi:asparagine synthase (glutamine-hydrolysing)